MGTNAGRPLPSGLVTFVFTDVEGSTRLFRALGDRYAPLLEAHRRLIRAAFDAHTGVEFSTAGDGFLFAFEEATDALSACVEAQLALEAHPWPDDGRIRVRMGIHRGQAEPVNGDYISIAVHEAARVAASAHGGQIVVSPQGAAALPGHQLRSLGRFWLRDFDQPVAMYQAVHDGLPTDFPEIQARRAGATTLRRRRSTFVGRDVELAKAIDALEPGAVLTVTGPGGAGKTRLAETLAARAEEASRAVVFVPLAPVTGGDVLRALADALDVGDPGATDLIEAVLARLDDGTLVVLDNCEHVRVPASRLIDDLLDRAPHLTFLVTSRQPLRLPDEQVLALGSLELTSTTEGEASPAVHLFAQRAEAAAGRPVVTPENEMVAAEICRRLDGLPFAIELAAARAASLPLPELLARLTDRFALLDDAPARRGDGRAETLFEVIEWSERLLDPAAAALLRRLSLFRGGFTLAAATAVCGYGEVDPDRVAMLVAALVDASLVSFDRRQRYDLLETTREFGHRRLAEHGERDETLGRLLDWLCQVVDAEEIRAGRVGAPYEVIDAEAENINAVLTLRENDPEVRRRQTVLALVLRRWFDRAGRYLDGWTVLADLIEAGDLPTQLEAEARAALAFLASISYEFVDPSAAAAYAVALARQVGDPVTLAFTLNAFAVTVERRDDPELGPQALNEAIDVVAGHGASALEVALRFNYVMALSLRQREDQLDGALDALAQAVPNSRLPDAEVMLHYARAESWWKLGRDEEAEKAALHGLALARAAGLSRYAGNLLYMLEEHAADLDQRREWLRQSAELWRHHPDRISGARAHAGMAVSARAFDDALADELTATARAMAGTLPPWVAEQVEQRLLETDPDAIPKPVTPGPIVPTAELPRPRPR